MAEIIRNKDDETVMVKKLVDGTKVLVLFNRNAEKAAMIKIEWEEFEECCSMKVFDVWCQKEIEAFKDGISVKLSPNGVALFVISH